MGSYTSGVMATSVKRIVLNGYAAVGDRLIATLNGMDVVYTVKAGDLDADGSTFSAFLSAFAAAINTSTAIDPVSKVPINQAFCAAGATSANVGSKYFLWTAVSPQPGYDHAFTLSTKWVPVKAGAQNPVIEILTASPNYFVAVTDTIAAGSVLSTTVSSVAIVNQSYTVVTGDTAASIAAKLSPLILAAEPHRIETVVTGGHVVVFEGELAQSVTLTASLTPPATTEKPTLYVSGRFLHDRHGNQVVLRGVDYPLADDYKFPGSNYLNEIAQTGANAIRIQWYITYGDPNRAPQLTPEVLGGFLDQCIAANIVPIVMISDDTSNGTSNAVNTDIVPWWTSAEVKAVMLARQQYLIVNIANELGFVRWSGDGNASAEYISAYQIAIQSMRAAGYTCPLMIDAPDDGTSIDEFVSSGAQLVSADPLGNVLLSVHAYWAGFDGRPYIPQAVAANLPIVFGEIANFEDEVADDGTNEYGYYALDGTGIPHPPNSSFTYQGLLTTLLADQVGWLSWCWVNDYCAARQMTPTGAFANLSPYGNDLVNNATYGLKKTAVRITQ
jgi:mannan endo-1,4-beta-mannosidase